MENENLVTVNLEELTNFVNELDSLNVTFDDELINTNLTEINENLKLLNDYIIVTEDLEDNKDSQVQTLETEPDLYLEELHSINKNLVTLNETIQTQRVDEFSELQVKAYGSNIIILFLIIVFGLFKGVSHIFGLANRTI